MTKGNKVGVAAKKFTSPDRGKSARNIYCIMQLKGPSGEMGIT